MESHIIKAVGVWFYCAETGRYLYLLRNDARYPGSWGLAGGKTEPYETLMQSLVRECQEELGSMPKFTQLVPLEKFTSADQVFEYHTFWCRVEKEFVPTLNNEHCGWAWIESGTWPKPLHPGLWNTVNLDAVQQKIAQIEHTI